MAPSGQPTTTSATPSGAWNTIGITGAAASCGASAIAAGSSGAVSSSLIMAILSYGKTDDIYWKTSKLRYTVQCCLYSATQVSCGELAAELRPSSPLQARL